MIGLLRRLIGWCPAHRRYGRPCLACAAEAAAEAAAQAKGLRGVRAEVEARLRRAVREGRMR